MKRLPGDVGFRVLIAMLYTPCFHGTEKVYVTFSVSACLGRPERKPRKSFASSSSDLGADSAAHRLVSSMPAS
jgi:hypothetical protein